LFITTSFPDHTGRKGCNGGHKFQVCGGKPRRDLRSDYFFAVTFFVAAFLAGAFLTAFLTAVFFVGDVVFAADFFFSAVFFAIATILILPFRSLEHPHRDAKRTS
jgi:hypothetical protein